MKQSPDVAGAEMEPCLSLAEEAYDVSVRDQNAFRPSGGARRINHIGKVVGSGREGKVDRTLLCDAIPAPIQADHLGRVRGRAIARRGVLG